MTHVEKLAERILFLKGEVEMFAGHPVEKIKDVREMLERAAKMEHESAEEYNQWANEEDRNVRPELHGAAIHRTKQKTFISKIKIS